MKKLFITFVILFSSSLIFSQDWALEWYKSGDKTFLTSQINKKFRQGYLPVGIEVVPDPNGEVVSLHVLYIKDQSLGIKAWYLDTYSNDTALEKGVNVMGSQGYVPKEVGYYTGTYYVLFLKFENNATAWTIKNAVYSDQGMSSTINKYDALGYVPFGYTLVNGELSILFVQIPLKSTMAWTVEKHSGLNAMQRGITHKQGKGWIPWAMLIDDSDYIIMYMTD